jgi:phospholipid/cholesterol/gamma-HCH transport system ATP-binding protein
VNDAIIELEGVWKAFQHEPVLEGVDLDVREGETFTILGGSGSGKSVCLKHMVGLLRADAGSVRVFGEDITDWSEHRLIPVRTAVSMIFQSAALFDSLSVYENIAYPLREHLDWPEVEIARRVTACLEAVGLPGIGTSMPAELSGGMRKRVGVARAIALEPAAILYDEPTTGLDPANSRRIGQLIATLGRRPGVTSVVVTHDLELCFAISDRVALLKAGRIAAEGSADEIRSSQQAEVRDFLEGTDDLGPEETNRGR